MCIVNVSYWAYDQRQGTVDRVSVVVVVGQNDGGGIIGHTS